MRLETPTTHAALESWFHTAISLDGESANASRMGNHRGAFGSRMLKLKAENAWEIVSHLADTRAKERE